MPGFINSATYSPEFPFALSLLKCGRSWFDWLTTTGHGYVVLFMKDGTKPIDRDELFKLIRELVL